MGASELYASRSVAASAATGAAHKLEQAGRYWGSSACKFTEDITILPVAPSASLLVPSRKRQWALPISALRYWSSAIP
ncbi:MAG: hypothetical protein OES46_08370 [Gammaproteobacteria bacterium]|nr:hypothetical protein [Gammaproteobacteria bacterium]